MQQQGEEPCESQENVHPESQDVIPEEVVPDATPPDVEGENDGQVSLLETPASTTAEEIDVENGNDSISSDTQSPKSKSSRSSKKRHNKQDNGNTDSAENVMRSEIRHDNGLPETDVAVDSSTSTIVEDDVQDIIVDECEEAITLETSGESSHAEYTVEFPVEDGNKEDSEDVLIEEEEIAISTSVSYEVGESKDKHSEVSEKYSLAVSSSELHQFTHVFDSHENVQEHASITENLSVSGSSWAGNIRSVSARKPMRNSSYFITRGRSSVSTERGGTDGNYSDTDCSVDTTEGSIFSSLKRKACDVDTTNSKKQKVNDSKNSKFFSMVSSPLRMLKNKLSDRIVDSLSASCPQGTINGNNEEEDDKVTPDKIKKEDGEIKEKSICIVSTEVSNQNSVYRNWCNLM